MFIRIFTLILASHMALFANFPNTTSTGLQYEDFSVGTGLVVKKGDVVEVHYIGWLYNDGQKGAQFDSSLPRGELFAFKVGSGMVIRGWDEGLVGMKVGGKRLLLIPSDLAYGSRGAGGVIPPNATLLFEVQLVKIESR